MVKSARFRCRRGDGRDAISTAGGIKRIWVSAALLFVGLALSSCSSFSGYVSDHWPTWAGGMPTDVPPRPGAPGYEEFISHQQARDPAVPAPAVSQAASADAGPQTPPPATPVTAPLPPNANAQVMPAIDRPPSDQAAVQGGLY
jgi:hypothetical protein